MVLILGVLLGVAHRAWAGDGACDVWLSPELVGTVARPGLDEASGLVVSAANPGVLWTHNDSGDDPVLYAMGAQGGDKGAYAVPRANNEDWEDLAAGPCPEDPGCSCLYAADIGDHDGPREQGIVYRFLEPDLSDSDRVAKAETLAFVYPDGAWDAEALVVDPATGAVFVITKVEDGPAGVYAFPEAPVEVHDEDDPAKLEWVTTLDLEAFGATELAITGASASPGGLRVAVRTAADLLVFSAPAGGSLYQAFSQEPAVLPMPETPDGEAVAFQPDGVSLTVLGEGEGALLWETRCASFTASEADLPEAGAACPAGGCGCAQTPDRAPPFGLAAALLFALQRGRRPKQACQLSPPVRS